MIYETVKENAGDPVVCRNDVIRDGADDAGDAIRDGADDLGGDAQNNDSDNRTNR